MNQMIESQAVPPDASGPCQMCNQMACFCPACIKVKGGKRLCSKCLAKAKDLGIDTSGYK